MAGKKTNYVKSGAAARHKGNKRIEAEARQEQHSKRTIAEQLRLLDERPGNSWREREKLLTLLEG
jgi:hypothetical protein